MIRTNMVQLAPLCRCYKFISLMLVAWIICIVDGSYGEEQKSTNPRMIDGEIIVDIVESGEKHNMFRVKPLVGVVRRFTGSVKPEWSQTGLVTHGIRSCHNNPTSISPDQKFIAECQGSVAPTNVGSKSDHFLLRQSGSKAILYQSDLPEAIIGSLWSQDSQAIAVLATTVRVSLNPRYWFYALSGHPMQHEAYFLHVIAVANGNVTTFKVPLETSFSAGYFVAWEQDETNRIK